MKARKYLFAGLVSLTGAGGAWAQFGAPPIPGPPVAAAAVPAAQPTTLWSYLGVSKAQRLECRRFKCQTPCGQMLGAMIAPMSMFTGGFIQPFCPLTPSLEELADPGAVGAAAKVKADEAGAKARRAAVRYLGTVDCHYWPEAEAALIESLRGDKNECVRYEAALSLGNGCCCTKKTMEALRIAASCSDTDGAPKETSDRVRAAAIIALEHCLSCFVDTTPPPEKIREGKAPEGSVPPPESTPPPVPQPDGVQSQPSEEVKTRLNTALKVDRPVGKAYYAKINQVPRQMIIDEARKTVARYNQTNSAYTTLRGHNSVVQIVERVSASPADDAGGTRAEVARRGPQNVWDMLVRQTNTPSTNPNVVTVSTTIAPPPPTQDVVAAMPQPTVTMQTIVVPQRMPAGPAMAKVEALPVPAISKVEPMPVADQSAMVVLPMPEPIRPLTPSDVVSSPYGNQVVAKPPVVDQSTTVVPSLPEPIKPRTPSDVVSSPYGNQVVSTPKAKVDMPARLPAVASVETPKTERHTMKPATEAKMGAKLPSEMPKTERHSMKPAIETKVDAKLSTPVVAKTPSPGAAHAMRVFAEVKTASVREQAADALTVSDMASCAELQPALIGLATGAEGDTTRKCAIKALVRTECANTEVMQTLEKLTEDSSAGIRVEAAIGLARLRLKTSKY